MMTEDRLGHSLADLLKLSTRELPEATRQSLQAARRQALARQRSSVRALSLAGISRSLGDQLHHRGRAVLALVLVLSAFIALDSWHDDGHTDALAEVDSALLGDDLPIDAYLDSGFAQWLHRDAD